MLIDKEIHPETLMRGIADTPLLTKVIYSLLAHVLIIGVLSVPFIVLCARYRTFKPREVIAAEKEKEKIEAAETAAREKAAAEKTDSGSAVKPDAEADAAGNTAATKDEVKGDTPIERAVTETSEDRPAHSATSFDDVDDLE